MKEKEKGISGKSGLNILLGGQVGGLHRRRAKGKVSVVSSERERSQLDISIMIWKSQIRAALRAGTFII